MEWISFSLDNDKKTKFETELMPTINNRYGSLLDMAGHTWSAYSKKNGIDSHQYIFCSDSPILNKFVKEFAISTTRLFTTPQTAEMDYFGPHHLNKSQENGAANFQGTES